MCLPLTVSGIPAIFTLEPIQSWRKTVSSEHMLMNRGAGVLQSCEEMQQQPIKPEQANNNGLALLFEIWNQTHAQTMLSVIQPLWPEKNTENNNNGITEGTFGDAL